MSRIDRWKDRLKGWKRLFLQNWSLFKASRMGLIGLSIMIFFVVMALAAPFMGLRDPLWWRAPDEDIVQVQKFWPLKADNSEDFGYSPINHTIIARFEAASMGTKANRVYVAAGSRLYALGPSVGVTEWLYPIDFSSTMWGDPAPTIAVDPLTANFGDPTILTRFDVWIYVATASGSVYGIHDDAPKDSPPPSPVRIGVMDGAATGLALFSGDLFEGHTEYDLVAAGSSNGTVYFWKVNETGHHGPYTISVGSSPVHMAGNPMRGTGPYPQWSPSFYYNPSYVNQNRSRILVGTEDGNLTSIDISSVTDPRIEWQYDLQTRPHPWRTAPIVHYVSEPVISTLVFAATYNGTLHALYATNGAPFVQWGGPKRIGLTVLTTDEGEFTQPFLEQASTNLYVGSTSGYLYSVSYVSLFGSGEPVQVRWAFRDVTRPVGTTYINNAPIVFGQMLVFVSINYDQGPPGPSLQDIGTIFAINLNEGSPSWSVTFDSPITSPLQAFQGQQVQPQLFLGTQRGSVFSYATTGLYLIPAPPSWIHEYPSGNSYLMGLDNRGRDIFSQWVWGSRIALFVGFASATFSITIGTMVGLVAGYFGGKIESVLMRFTDVILVIPGLPLIITLAAVLGSSVTNLILVISIVGWPGVARVIRSQVLSLKERPFIESARVTGASHARIMGKHILPNVLPLAFLYMTFAVSGAILSEAALSFIGLGDIQTVSWGRMLQDVTQSQALKAWWWLLPPGLAITLISLGFFLIGRAFDEIVNPRLRKR